MTTIEIECAVAVHGKHTSKLMTNHEIAEDRRATAEALRKAAATEGRIAARWLSSRDGRTRRRAVRAARTAVHYVGLAERFEATANTLTGEPLMTAMCEQGAHGDATRRTVDGE